MAAKAGASTRTPQRHEEQDLLDATWIAGSGTVSHRYQRWVADVVGTERMPCSTDYPITFGLHPGRYPLLDTSNGVARSFPTGEASFSREQVWAISSGNRERLTRR